MELNTNQMKAVSCSLDPTIVIAGPGSGKTQVICHRIRYMMQELGCLPHQILVVTFSKMAAEEMKERYIRQFGEAPIHFGTLHSVFYRILRRSQPERYDMAKLLLEDKRKLLLSHLLKEMETDEGEEFLDGFIRHLSLMKNQLIRPKEYEPTGISKPAFLELVQRYEAYKERHGLFDFDDMLVECYYLLKEDALLLDAVSRSYRYVLVDEFQDINLVQFEIIKLIVEKHQHLFVVGDDDQSIYQFRGAKPEYLLDFKKHFPTAQTVYLNVNYRCSQNILNHSLALINENKVRYQKKLTTPNAMGALPFFKDCKDAKEEAMQIIHELSRRKQQGVPLKEMAVIYRTNLQARPIVEALIAANIPFCLRDGMISLYDQWITKDILAYLHLAQGQYTEEEAIRIINKPKRYISKANIEKAKSQSGGSLFIQLLQLETLSPWQKNYMDELLFNLQVLKGKALIEGIRYIRHHIGYANYLAEYAAYRKMPVSSLIEVLDDIEESAMQYEDVMSWEESLIQMAQHIQKNVKNRQADMLTLTTMHGAKGLEYDTVFVLDVVDGMVPYHKSQQTLEIEEERRLLYVAMTRAKQQLFLYLPHQKHGKDVAISPFILEMKQNMARQYLKVGQKLRHQHLGLGEIIEVQDKGMIIVQFNQGQKRKIDSIYCINNAIITWEDESNENK